MNVHLRLLLPLLNLAIDIALLVATIYVVDMYRAGQRHPWPLWDQRYERVDRDFLKNADGPPMPAPLQAMHVGTLPAAVISGLTAEALLANGAHGWKTSSPFDLRLVVLHLCLACVFWYGIARTLERPRQKWTRAVWWYVSGRFLSIPASLTLPVGGWWMACVLLFLAIWMIVAALVAIDVGRHVLDRVRS